jgi:chorismate dehydratase
MSPDELPKLRLVTDKGRLREQLERENEVSAREREFDLADSLAPFRVGSVPYLNAVPLTRGVESEVAFVPPSRLGEMLLKNDLDAALLSITEVLLRDRYDILDGVAIASLGEVYSVFLAHRGPIEEAREIYCDPASLTSVQLLRVLLAERGIRPEFKPLSRYEDRPDYMLLIGDTAIDFQRAPHEHAIWDLGTAWSELTRLPFVYAVWALRRDVDTTPLRQKLREARDFGLDTLDHIITSRSEYDLDFRRDYLGWHIHYHLGTDERRGIARFAELLRKHTCQEVFAPRYVI